jgi:hypothetical protein
MSGNKLVSDVVHCLKMNGLAGVFLQLVTKSQDVVVHGSCRRVVVVAPNLIEQLLARDRTLLVSDEELQELELLGRQVDVPAIP